MSRKRWGRYPDWMSKAMHKAGVQGMARCHPSETSPAYAHLRICDAIRKSEVNAARAKARTLLILKGLK